MNLHLRGRQAEQFGQHRLVVGLHLRAEPRLATALRQPDHTIHRLHGRVGEVGEVVLGLEHLLGPRQRAIRTACLMRNSAR
ncbi:hypothetical protein D3C87_2106870 [compost metagenome]